MWVESVGEGKGGGVGVGVVVGGGAAAAKNNWIVCKTVLYLMSYWEFLNIVICFALCCYNTQLYLLVNELR